MSDNKNMQSLPPAAGPASSESNAVETPRSINFILDIPLELTVEVGRRNMTMGELIDLLPGTVVELDRPAGGQLDILANGKIIAKGEAVVVGDRYGVRILEVLGDDPFNAAGSNAGGTL
jgi:flagellar motor switch protein FliN/FliY